MTPTILNAPTVKAFLSGCILPNETKNKTGMFSKLTSCFKSSTNTNISKGGDIKTSSSTDKHNQNETRRFSDFFSCLKFCKNKNKESYTNKCSQSPDYAQSRLNPLNAAQARFESPGDAQVQDKPLNAAPASDEDQAWLESLTASQGRDAWETRLNAAQGSRKT